MSFIKIFLILTGYQITWLSCVLGEKLVNQPLLGFVVGLIFTTLYFYYSKNKSKLFLIILFIAVPGYLFDSIIVYLNVYEFNSNIKIGVLPIWMLALWISFAILFDKVFVFFKNYQKIGILFSTTLGPLTYYSGAPIGIIEINNLFLFSLIMIIFWSLLMLYYLKVIIKKISIH